MPAISRDMLHNFNGIIEKNLETVIMKLLMQKDEDFASLSEPLRKEVVSSFSNWFTSCAGEYDGCGSMDSDILSLEDVTDGKQDEPLSENGTIIYNALQRTFPPNQGFENEEERKYYLTLWSREFQGRPDCEEYIRKLRTLRRPSAEFFSDWSYAGEDVAQDRCEVEDRQNESPFARLHYIISRRC